MGLLDQVLAVVERFVQAAAVFLVEGVVALVGRLCLL